MTFETKQSLRQHIKKLKALISEEEKIEKSNMIFVQVEENEHFKSATTVMLYWAMSDEVQTKDFILKHYKSKRIILPSVCGEVLVLKEFSGLENLTNGELYNIPEPQGVLFEKKDEIELIIVPGVAFDKQNNRMGRGKAYYDKLLKNLNAYKLGVCFDFQFFESIPTDEFDVKMDAVFWA